MAILHCGPGKIQAPRHPKEGRICKSIRQGPMCLCKTKGYRKNEYPRKSTHQGPRETNTKRKEKRLLL